MARAQDILEPQEDFDETFQLISWWDVDKVRNAKVMVIGAGALGNEVLKNLALLNVGNIVVVDFDRIERRNLCRSVLFRTEDAEQNQPKAQIAAQRIKEINPDVKLEVINGDIMIDVGLGVFREMDAIIGCLDNRLARYYVNKFCQLVGKSWIDSGIGDVEGYVAVYAPGVNCYASSLLPQEWKAIYDRIGCADVARRNSNAGRIPTTPITSSIMAAIQVQEALKIVHNQDAQSLIGKKLIFNGMYNVYEIMEMVPPDEKYAEPPLEDVIDKLELSHLDSFDHFFREVAKETNEKVESLTLSLDYDIVTKVSNDHDGRQWDVMIPKPHFSDEKIAEFQNDVFETVLFSEFRNDFGFEELDGNAALASLGIPKRSILKVIGENDVYFVQLTKDNVFSPQP